MNYRIEILIGEKVFAVINDKRFISGWERLAKKNNKVTVIQEQAFVLSWYSQYYDKYDPVFVLAFDK